MFTFSSILTFISGIVIGFLLVQVSFIRLKLKYSYLQSDINALNTALLYTKNELKEKKLQNVDSLNQLLESNKKNKILAAQFLETKNGFSCCETKNNILQSEVSKLISEKTSLKQKYKRLLHELNEKMHVLLKEKFALESELSKVNNYIDIQKSVVQEKISLLEGTKKNLNDQFESLANRIFDEKKEKISSQSKTDLFEILQPFKHDIKDFKRKIEDVYIYEAKERASLQKEINSLFHLNQAMNKEAKNLTKALKGDKKLQGDWGEVVLERVLETSGLRKGHEYEIQNTYRSESQNGKLFRPDVIVHLPDGKDIIIDSKISLVNYNAYMKAESEDLRSKYLKIHIDSIRQHINLLSDKNYEALVGINSLDFILMFIPVEAAFVAAFQYDESLFHDVFKKHIIVVTPTTLLATLGTIRNTWKYNIMNKNTNSIVERVSKMLDKFRGFVDDIESFGRHIEKLGDLYEGSLNKLSKGKGNLISQAMQLERMGFNMKKKLSKNLVSRAEVESEDIRQ